MIDKFGGPHQMAEALTASSRNGPIRRATIYMWQTRNDVPADHWPTLLRAAQVRGIVGITLDGLEDLATAARHRRLAAKGLTAPTGRAPSLEAG